MNFSLMNSSISATSNVYWARALDACDFIPRSGGSGSCIIS